MSLFRAIIHSSLSFSLSLSLLLSLSLSLFLLLPLVSRSLLFLHLCFLFPSLSVFLPFSLPFSLSLFNVHSNRYLVSPHQYQRTDHYHRAMREKREERERKKERVEKGITEGEREK